MCRLFFRTFLQNGPLSIRSASLGRRGLRNVVGMLTGSQKLPIADDNPERWLATFKKQKLQQDVLPTNGEYNVYGNMCRESMTHKFIYSHHCAKVNIGR